MCLDVNREIFCEESFYKDCMECRKCVLNFDEVKNSNGDFDELLNMIQEKCVDVVPYDDEFERLMTQQSLAHLAKLAYDAMKYGEEK